MDWVTGDTEYEIVYTMTDYWDGPRGGIANFRGKPHVYQALFDYTQDDGTDIFLLKPIDEETLQMALEAWAIWLRWEKAFYEDQSGLEMRAHPALPEDRQRRDELDTILEPRLKVDSGSAIRVRGDFKVREPRETKKGWQPLLVRWIPISGE